MIDSVGDTRGVGPDPGSALAGSGQPAILIEDLSKRYVLDRRRRARLRRHSSRFAGQTDVDELDEDVAPDEQDPPEAADDREGTGAVVWALRDVSFVVARGAALGIIGGSGAGKTTLLKIIARVTPPTTGRVLVAGRVAPLLGSIAGLMEGNFTGRHNVRLLAQLLGVPRSITARQLDRIFEFAGLTAFADTKVKKYSPGLRQQLAFSVMLHLEPDVIVADNSLSVGDPEFRARAAQAIADAHADGLTLLLASGDMPLIRRVCDEVVWLDRGSVVDRGDPVQLTELYESRAKAKRRGRGEPAKTVPPPAAAKPRVKRANVLTAGLFAMDGLPIERISPGEEALIEVTVTAPTAVAILCGVTVALDGRPCVRVVQPEPFDAPGRGAFRASAYVSADALPAGAVLQHASAVLVHERSEAADAAARDVLFADSPGAEIPEVAVDAWAWERARKRYRS